MQEVPNRMFWFIDYENYDVRKVKAFASAGALDDIWFIPTEGGSFERKGNLFQDEIEAVYTLVGYLDDIKKEISDKQRDLRNRFWVL